MTHRRSISGICLGVVAFLACADASDPDAMVFEGARVIVGDGSPPIEDAVIVIDGGRFAAIGARDAVDVPRGATRIDLTGKTVMPAIVNAHVHLAQDRETRTEQLQHMAYYGAGTVQSLGHDSGAVAVDMDGEYVSDGARGLTTGRGITRQEPGRSEASHWIDTEDEARAAVRDNAERNVDLIKIWVDDRGGRYDKLTSDLYGPIIAEAHTNGIKVTAHIFTLDDAKDLLRAGIDGFAHGIRDRDIDDELVALWREHPNTYLVPNLPNPGVATDLDWLSGTVPAERLAELQEAAVDRPELHESFGIQARNLDRLSDEGMVIAFGTDGSTPWAVHLEMEDMVKSGMSPAEVIAAATGTSARALDLDDVGTIAAGKNADFIVLDANPLEDITNTRRINAVYLRGVEVDREALSAKLLGN